MQAPRRTPQHEIRRGYARVPQGGQGAASDGEASFRVDRFPVVSGEGLAPFNQRRLKKQGLIALFCRELAPFPLNMC